MDKKSRFFKTVVLSQFILIVVIGILMSTDFRNDDYLKIRGIHPYEFNFGLIVPLFVFVICLILSIFTLFLKQQIIEESDDEDLKKLRQKNFWKFAFYSNIFFLISIAAFSISVFQEEPLKIFDVPSFYWYVIVRSVLVVVLSLVVASFLLAVGIYWKTNKSLAISILVFSVIIISIFFAVEAFYIKDNAIASDYFQNQQGGVAVHTETALPDTEYEDSESEDETELKLIASWKDLMKDWGLLNAENDFSDIRFLMKRSIDDHIVESDYYYLLEYAERLKENPEELYSGFEKYNHVLYTTLTPILYHSSNMDKVVDGLLITYDDVGDNNEKLEEIYRIMNVPEGEFPPDVASYYPELEKYCNQKTLKKLNNYKISGGDELSYSDLVWFYSFWARRNHEGNAKEIAIILNEIQEHYNPASNSNE